MRYVSSNLYCYLYRAYKNAGQKDLWDIMTEEAHKYRVIDNTLTVKDVMDTWILQSGYPIVNVTRNYEDDTLTIFQVPIIVQSNRKS